MSNQLPFLRYRFESYHHIMEIITPEIDKIPLTKWLKLDFLVNDILSKECHLLLKNHVWITARKVKIHVKKMTTSHIRNCINCWNGQGNMIIPDNYLGGKKKWLKIFEHELLQRN